MTALPERSPREIALREVIAEPVAAQAVLRPQSPALISGLAALSWAEVEEHSRIVAARLLSLGAGASSKIAVVDHPSVDSAILIYAIGRLGATAVMLSPRIKVDTARGAGGEPSIFVTTLPENAAFPEAIHINAVAPSKEIDAHLRTELLAPDTHCVLFTSASTGKAKPITLTNSNFEANALSAEALLGVEADDRWLACLPLSHIGGFAIFQRCARIGASVIPVSHFEPKHVLHAAEESKATIISVVPTMLRRLLDAGLAGNSHLRVVIAGGAPCPPDLIASAAGANVPLAIAYGLTETTSFIAASAPGQSPALTELRIGPGIEVVIGQSPEHPERAGRRGPLWVRGPQVCVKATTGGWLRTTDVAELTPDARLVIHGREDDMVLTGGEKVSPQEVQLALQSHAGVAEAAVIARPNTDWGEELVGCVVLHSADAPEPQELRAFLKQRLAYFKIPRTIRIVAAIPKDASGQVDTRALLASLSQTAGSDETPHTPGTSGRDES